MGKEGNGKGPTHARTHTPGVIVPVGSNVKAKLGGIVQGCSSEGGGYSLVPNVMDWWGGTNNKRVFSDGSDYPPTNPPHL